jgi:hypothetical protein
MMRLGRRASLLVVFCLLMSAATAYAECAWVLWARYAKPPYTEWTSWSSVNYWETKSRCWRKITDLTSVPEEGSFADLVAWTFGKGLYEQKDQGLRRGRGLNGATLYDSARAYEYICLPDTVDPRGPKVK